MQTSEMESFVYDSQEFRDSLGANPHLAGEVRFLQSIARQGMNIIDVGANKGITTVALAKSVGETGRVYAFEPVPEFYVALKGNLSSNGEENVTAYQLALSNVAGRIKFYKRGRGSGIVSRDEGEEILVNSTTIDDFTHQEGIMNIELISMDCEGSELFVLQGAKKMLSEQCPRIFCEIHHDYLKSLGQSVSEIVSYLGELAFRIRPVLADDLDKIVGLEQCSHIYAEKPRTKSAD